MKVAQGSTFLNVGYAIILQILADYLDICIYTHDFWQTGNDSSSQVSSSG